MSKYIQLNNDFGIDRAIEKEVIDSDEEITLNWIGSTVRGAFPNIKPDQRRLFAKIMDKMDIALKNKYTYLEVNDIEFLFLKSAFEKWEVPAATTKSVTIVENAVFNATNQPAENQLTTNPGIMPA